MEKVSSILSVFGIIACVGVIVGGIILGATTPYWEGFGFSAFAAACGYFIAYDMVHKKK